MLVALLSRFANHVCVCMQLLCNVLTKEETTLCGVEVGEALALQHGLAALLADMLHALERHGKRIVGVSSAPQV
jgi:hypothetical protein